MEDKTMIITKSIKNKSLIGLVGALLVMSTGCTDKFEEYNTNPDQASEEQTNWDNVRTGSFFLQMQQNVAIVAQPGYCGSDRYQVVEVMGGDTFVGYHAQTAPNLNGSGRYNWTTSWDDQFNTGYGRTMNAWRELKRIIKDDNDPRLAIATIMKVATMHRVTDSYGPIPYSQFGISKEVPYESQSNVYMKFFEELDHCIQVLDSYAAIDAKVNSDWDLVFNGSTQQWVKFANTLRLRLAMHIAYVDPTEAKKQAEFAASNPRGLLSVKNDIVELQHMEPLTNYESPLYVINNWGDVIMGATIDSYMNGYNDPRRKTYFKETADRTFRGARTGMPDNIAKNDYDSDQFSKLNVNSTTNVVWMRASESYFLRAEGALRGWNMGGQTAKEYYKQGVRLSFEEQGVTGADEYLANTKLTPANYNDPVNSAQNHNASSDITIAWDEEDKMERKLERIITQKYIAMYPIGMEAWTEFRRTGYPKVFKSVSNQSNGGSVSDELQIRRLPFPKGEYNTNAAALAGGIALLKGADTPGTKLWWDAK